MRSGRRGRWKTSKISMGGSMGWSWMRQGRDGSAGGRVTQVVAAREREGVVSGHPLLTHTLPSCLATPTPPPSPSPRLPHTPIGALSSLDTWGHHQRMLDITRVSYVL
ncbi:hypothetical protein Pmani_025707 [Petrolisthes manimaculis]|uniref:Uncharacterized protein n=1 Tax=Petrolisthes manimaculis TaxID=1843537 RepID=A0AAE1U0X7_9EUCA|nr:hypothetical protein Pmani_025707 [Petrolisthes manimaculis]